MLKLIKIPLLISSLFYFGIVEANAQDSLSTKETDVFELSLEDLMNIKVYSSLNIIKSKF